MIKNAVAPIQAWLLSQKRCVGCGRELVEFKTKKKGSRIMVHCECRRVYVFNTKTKRYRRALLSEI